MSEGVPDTVSITFLSGPLAGQTFQVTKPITTIGRDAENDIVVKGDPGVSRQHACLRWGNESWSIENLSQQNTLSVDQRPVRKAAIQDQSIIGLGKDTTFLFRTQIAPPALEEEISARPTVYAQQPPAHSSSNSEREAGSTPSAPASISATAQRGPAESSTNPIVRQSQTIVMGSDTLGIPTLEVNSITSGRRRPYPLDKPVITVGRDMTNDRVLPRFGETAFARLL